MPEEEKSKKYRKSISIKISLRNNGAGKAATGILVLRTQDVPKINGGLALVRFVLQNTPKKF